MAEKVSSIWTAHRDWPGQKDFDKDYEKISILDKVIKTGEGEEDFIVKKIVVVEKQPIAEVVAVDADSVGVYNIMKSLAFQRDPGQFADSGSGEVVDMTGAPEDLMQLKQLGVDAEKAFAALPEDLTKGLDMASFVNSMSQEKFDEFVKAIQARADGKKEEKVNE